MALAYLLDPTKQYQNRAGVNNVDGWLEVFLAGTDDRADVYVNFDRSRAEERIGIDNNGRAVMIVEAGVAYRVEMHEPNGELVYTQEPIFPVQADESKTYDVVSSNHSIVVDKTVVGNDTTFDLSVAEDDVNRLDWIRCEGSRLLACSDIYLPVYADGPMEVGSVGVRLGAGKYYHVTAHIRATKSAVSPWYDRVFVVLSQKFPTGPDTVITNQSFVVDGSMELVQDFEVSCDTMVESDCELKIEIVGDLNNVTYAVTDLEIHRVYSGVAQGGGGSGPVEQVQSDWEETDTEDPSYIRHKPGVKPVVAGDGIIITETTTEFTISATAAQEQVQSDWTENDTEDPSYIKHKPTLATVATTGDYDDLTNKPTIPAAQVNSNWTATSGVAAILNKPTLATVATSGDYNDLSNLPTIPSDKVYIFWDMEFNRAAIRGAIDAHKVIMCWDRVTHEHRFFTEYEEKVIDGNLCELYHFAYVQTDYNTPFATSWSLGDHCFIFDTVRLIQYMEHDVKLFDHEVPSPTSSDAGKVLTASWNSDQAAGSWSWQTASTPTVDQTYNSSSTDAQSGVAVAGALATINQVPSSTSADEDKVLTVNSSGNPVWATPQGGGGGGPYTAGDGIDIDAQDVISVKVDGTSVVVNAAGELVAVGHSGSQVQADWTEASLSSPAYIKHKPSLATVATSGDYNDLTNKPTIPSSVTVDQTYNSSSTNAQSGTAVAGALATVNQVPSVTSSDGDKILTATWNSGTSTGSFSWQAKPTVDQTYDALSTNAQSGVAVASAISDALGTVETALSNL